MSKNIKGQFIVFSDLDATLLDHYSYSFTDAKSALKIIRNKNIPLILISSKTRSEIEYYQKQLNICATPFVVENGCAIYCPIDYFKDLKGNYERIDNYYRFD